MTTSILQLLAEQASSNELLYEHLGNLAQLKAGKLIDLLKQRSGKTPIDNKFAYSAFGTNSEIVDVGEIKNGLTDLKKAYRKAETAQAFALYVNGKIVALGTFGEYDLNGPSRTGGLAFDLSQFKDKLEKEYEDRVASASDWMKNLIEKPKIDSTKIKERAWRDKTFEYRGEDESTAGLKKFIENLKMLADGSPITCKLVLSDADRQKKTMSRADIRRSMEEGMESLQDRLKKYKLSKRPTAENVKHFIEMALKKAASEVQFAGDVYSTTPKEYYSSNTADVIMGKPFKISFKSVVPGHWSSSVDVAFVFDVVEGTLKPYTAEWSDRNKKVKSILDSNKVLKHDYGVKDPMSKDDIIRRLLMIVKQENYAMAKDLIKVLRDKYDWPELDAVEKSLNSSKKES